MTTTQITGGPVQRALTATSVGLVGATTSMAAVTPPLPADPTNWITVGAEQEVFVDLINGTTAAGHGPGIFNLSLFTPTSYGYFNDSNALPKPVFYTPSGNGIQFAGFSTQSPPYVDQAYQFGPGETIDSSLQFKNEVPFLPHYLDGVYDPDTASYETFLLPYTDSDWFTSSERRGYVGLVMDTGDGEMYGWLDVTYNNLGSGQEHSVIIHGTSFEPIPEASTTAAIAAVLAGCATLYQRRRSSKTVTLSV